MKEGKKCCCTVGKAFSMDYSTAEKWKKNKALEKKPVFISQRTDNLIQCAAKAPQRVSQLRVSVSLLGMKQQIQLKDAFQADETTFYEFSLEAIALQKESFLQVLNKDMLFKHKLTAMNVQETFSVKLQVVQKHAGQCIMQANAKSSIIQNSLLAEVGDSLRNFPCFSPTH